MAERWFDEELLGYRLGDGRLDRRLRQLVGRMDAGFGETLPLACQDWASTNAAYCFFSNERVSEEDILRGHFNATRQRFAASDGPILFLHDTTESSGGAGVPRRWLHDEGEQRQGRARPRAHAYALRAADAFEPGGNDGGVAAGNGLGQVLDPQEVQGDESSQEKDQPNARADRGQGEHALAGQSAAIHRTGGRSRALRSHLRPRGRHPEVVLSGRGAGHPPRHQAPFRQFCRRRLGHGGIDDGRGKGPRAALGRRPR